MQYGHFDDDAREYVIDSPYTPLPWMNYLGQQDYFGLVSNTGGGYSFYRDARLRRLTRYRYNNLPLDTGGRYLYLRDDESEAYWSATVAPIRPKKVEYYRCRHGLGYSSIELLEQGLRSEVTYFVPLDSTLEVWDLRLRNERQTPLKLSIFSFVEFALWDAWDDQTNYQRNFNTGEVEVDQGVIYHKTEYRERRDHFAYFASSVMPQGFETSRDAFFGPTGDWKTPQTVIEGRASNSIAHGWAPVGSHHLQVTLQPGEESRLFFVLGYHENPRDAKFDPPGSQTLSKQGARAAFAPFLHAEGVDAARAALKARWDNLLAAQQVQTPDEHSQRMVNIWNAYQCMVTFNMSRSASAFESGIGRGMGFRDSNQDLLGFVHMIPERARERILDISATQLESGGAYHQYQTLTKRGNDAVGGNFNDDPLWLVLGVCSYLKETGDFGLLDEPVVYDNKAGSEQPMMDHLWRALRYTLDRLGPHGLPLIGRADWNDCLNLNTFSSEPGESFQTTGIQEGKVAESVFIAGLFTLAAQEMAQLLDQLQQQEEAAHWSKEASRMAAVVLEHGWDGEWFRRAYDAYGKPVGSRLNEEGQIFIEPQGICVMAGIGQAGGQALQALDSVARELATPHGIVLQQPAYTRYHLELGEISSYPPGYKENAGIFCHNNPWIMIAEALSGRGDRAYDYYMRINPSAREAISEVHRCEPYIYAQMIAGKNAPTHGEAKNSWLTGTAAWNYVAITQYILGIQPGYAGLRIDPCIPSEWESFEVKRKFRGASYHIRVHNPEHQHRGVKSISVDGKAITGQTLPLAEAGQTVRVEVVLG